ncbi:hypothetical protein BpHYR1_022821 [Brachionus plicatilis]|uniref:Uncharacterized protein n=1 Tax=Brachionus plicatilis TaxID=10195 RepID=A0A3M7QQK6_BRAPC|nr:hypothetical protein BpHYR1_022821 [Brachionus plicatilis]
MSSSKNQTLLLTGQMTAKNRIILMFLLKAQEVLNLKLVLQRFRLIAINRARFFKSKSIDHDVQNRDQLI